MKLKIVAMSDFHGTLPEITESADIAIIAGDLFPLNIQFNKPKSQKWVENVFAHWVNIMPVDMVYLVGGNHDAYFESISKANLQDLINACHGKLVYLENETADYFSDNGLLWTIFGTPYCHIFGNWPFMRSNAYMSQRFKEIPEKVDIIISHDPPFGAGDVDVILDTTIFGLTPFIHLGNQPLRSRIASVDYKILFCGHIHSGAHTLDETWKTVNVSYLNEHYKPHYPPFYVEIEHN